MEAIFNSQKEYSKLLSNSNASERIEILKRLKKAILDHREEIKEAVYLDFKKPYSETELTEIHTSLDEINFAIKNVKKWMKTKKVCSPLSIFGASSHIQYKPKGVVLLISPWNYPFSMVIHPLVAALAGGNAVCIKASEKSHHMSKFLEKFVQKTFKPKEVSIFLGGPEVTQKLLDFRFDHIFFTGNSNVGKIIMQRASENLIPVTLELGGKSPVIIDRDANLEDAADKISWGKFVNAGQTCVAPDHIFVHRDVKSKFVALLKAAINKKFGVSIEEQFKSESFARIIDDAAYERLRSYLEEFNIPEAKDSSERFIPPTILENATNDNKIMKEEIFGPILPILEFSSLDHVIEQINNRPKPLALYLFTKNNGTISSVLTNTTSGGMSINHVLMQLANPRLPFGGVGGSGMGNYHGEFGFKTFSHERAVLKQSVITFTKFYFQPYTTKLSKLAYKLIRFLE